MMFYDLYDVYGFLCLLMKGNANNVVMGFGTVFFSSSFMMGLDGESFRHSTIR